MAGPRYRRSVFERRRRADPGRASRRFRGSRGMSGSITPPFLAGAQLIPVPAGEKNPNLKGWPEIRLSPAEAEQHVRRGGNLAMRVGSASGRIVDSDLDCSEALALADLYLPATQA